MICRIQAFDAVAICHLFPIPKNKRNFWNIVAQSHCALWLTSQIMAFTHVSTRQWNDMDTIEPQVVPTSRDKLSRFDCPSNLCRSLHWIDRERTGLCGMRFSQIHRVRWWFGDWCRSCHFSKCEDMWQDRHDHYRRSEFVCLDAKVTTLSGPSLCLGLALEHFTDVGKLSVPFVRRWAIRFFKSDDVRCEAAIFSSEGGATLMNRLDLIIMPEPQSIEYWTRWLAVIWKRTWRKPAIVGLWLSMT